LKRDPVFNIDNSYFSRAALNAIADNAGASRIDDLRYRISRQRQRSASRPVCGDIESWKIGIGGPLPP
jgi:hypothetical protein